MIAPHGEVAERLNALPWKGSIGVILSGVRIPPSPQKIRIGFLMRNGIINGLFIPDEIRQIKPNCGSVAILANEMTGETTRSFVQLFPEYQKIIF